MYKKIATVIDVKEIKKLDKLKNQMKYKMINKMHAIIYK